jgi:hypothetical protein
MGVVDALSMALSAFTMIIATQHPNEYSHSILASSILSSLL